MVIGVHNITFKSYTAGSYFGEIEAQPSGLITE